MNDRRIDDLRANVTARLLCVLIALVPAIAFAQADQSGADDSAADSVVSGGIVVVIPEAFRPGLKTWIQRREASGHSVTIVRPRSTAQSTKTEIRDAAAKAKDDGIDVNAILLVGDMPVVGRHCNPTREVPANYPPSKVTRPWGAPPTIASDASYGDFNDDGKIDAVVGRLPFDSAQQVADYVDRVVAYEDSRDFGPWRSHIQLTGGIGGFGAVADAAVESVTRSIVTGVLPTETKTSVAYASPGHRYYPAGESFRDAVIDRYNDGCAYWVYAGHGWIDHLDKVPPTADGTPVLDSKSVSELDRPAAAAPIAVMLSCYTGAIDAGQDALAERMLAHDGGPIAVFAGSRVTMPYGNSTAALGLIDGVFEQHLPTLGQAWLSSLQSMNRPDDDAAKSGTRMIVDAMAAMVSPPGTVLHDERQEHTLLYNLLGDPTLRLSYPEPAAIDLKAWQDASQSPLDINITSPISGLATFTIERPIGSSDGDDPNGMVIKTVTHQITAGQPWRPDVVISEQLRGQFLVRVHVASANAWATGAAKLVLR